MNSNDRGELGEVAERPKSENHKTGAEPAKKKEDKKNSFAEAQVDWDYTEKDKKNGMKKLSTLPLHTCETVRA